MKRREGDMDEGVRERLIMRDGWGHVEKGERGRMSYCQCKVKITISTSQN